MREKEPMANTQDYGKDEDSSEALLKKHEALLSDLEAFGNTIKALREQANSCRVSETCHFMEVYSDNYKFDTTPTYHIKVWKPYKML